MKGDEFSGLVFYDKKGVAYSKNEAQLIAENIKRIITTRPGERVGEPEFGSNVLTYLFMPQVYIKDVIAEIISSINKQEPRVTVNSCTLKSAGQDDVIHINLDITLNTESKENLEIGVAI